MAEGDWGLSRLSRTSVPSAGRPSVVGGDRAPGAGSARLITDTSETTGWPSIYTEDEWYSVLYERYVRYVPREEDPKKAALKLYKAGQDLQHMSAYIKAPQGIRYGPVELRGCAVGLSCPAWSRCDWCNCVLWPCMCGTGSYDTRVSAARRVPVGPTRWEARGGSVFMEKLLKAAAEGCMCPLEPTGHVFCAADRLDFMCDKGRNLDFNSRRRMRILADVRAREYGTFKEEYDILNHRHVGRTFRSVATQTYMELDDKTMYVGPGRIIIPRASLRRKRKWEDNKYKGLDASYTYHIGHDGRPIFPTNPDGKITVPFDDDKNPIFPTNMAGDIIFPLNKFGHPTVPFASDGTPIFPKDSDGNPIFPKDEYGNFLYPRDDNGYPIFPLNPFDPIVPVDINGYPIFPTDAHGNIIWPKDKDGNILAPIDLDGKPMFPMDSKGEPIFPRKSDGTIIFPKGPTGAPVIPLGLNDRPLYPKDEYGYPIYPKNKDGDPVVAIHPTEGYPMFPRDSEGDPLLPRDKMGNYIFPKGPEGYFEVPYGADGKRYYPKDASGYPIFPSGADGQPIVPTDSMNQPIFPRNSKGRAIFPKDSKGNIVYPKDEEGYVRAPVGSQGQIILPRNEHGKMVHPPLGPDGAPLMLLPRYKHRKTSRVRSLPEPQADDDDESGERTNYELVQFVPEEPSLASLPGEDEPGLAVYDLRGVQFSLHSMYPPAKQQHWLSKLIRFFKWDPIINTDRKITCDP